MSATIVIPNRTKRWFHDWKPRHRLTGLDEQIGVSIPITSSGQYLGISRTGAKIPKGL